MDELVLNYQIAGEGPPLLLIHGFGISFNIWNELAPLLSQYFTLVIVELPGIGKSKLHPAGEGYLCATIKALERVRRETGFDTWQVLGYSTGSRIAEAYVQTNTAHVKKAVFLCPLQVENFKLVILRFSFWLDRFFPAFIPWMLSGWRLKNLILLWGFSLRPDAHVDEWKDEISSASLQALKETTKMMIPIGKRPLTVPVPFSLIWCDRDFVTIRPHGSKENSYFIHSTHAAPILAPEEISEIVNRFLDKS